MNSEPLPVEVTLPAMQRLAHSLCVDRKKRLLKVLVAFIKANGKGAISIVPCTGCQGRAAKAAGLGFA